MLTAHCIGASIKPIRAHLDLGRALFAGGVKNPTTATGERGGGLQEQRALSDTGIATNERHAAGDQSAAKDTIEFRDTGRRSWNIMRLHFRDRLRASTTARGGEFGRKFKCAVRGARGDIRRFSEALQSIPCAAIGALAHPLGLNIAAFTTDETGLDLCHWKGRV